MADVRLSLPLIGPIAYHELTSLAAELEAEGLKVDLPPRPIEKKSIDWETASEIAVIIQVVGASGTAVYAAVQRWLKKKRHPNQLPVVGTILDKDGNLLREVRQSEVTDSADD